MSAEWVQTETGLIIPGSCQTIHRQTPAGIYAPDHYIHESKPDRPLAVGLFVGAGGMSLGMTMAGFHEIAALEYDTSAAHTYMTNLGAYPIKIHFATPEDEIRLERELTGNNKRKAKAGILEQFSVSGSGWISAHPEHQPGCEHFFLGDIRQFDPADMLRILGLEQGEINVVAGGPPCQGLSLANSNRCTSDPRNAMLWEYMRFIKGLLPKTFVIENVPPLLTAAKGGFLKEICRIANELGYNVVANVLDAVNYGVPQYRRRAFIVGTLHGAPPFQFPMPTNWCYGSYVDGSTWGIGEVVNPDDDEEDDAARYDEESGVFVGADLRETRTAKATSAVKPDLQPALF